MTLLVRDEEDIIAANIEHHMARGVDLIVVTDNGSVDATVEILRFYEKQGPLHLLHEPTDDYSQARWVTRMARICAAEGADWVINSDADEFWWPRTASDLKQPFEQLPPEVGVVSVARHNFSPRREDGRPCFERRTFGDLTSVTSRGRPLPPKVAHRAHPQAKVRMGNHRVKGPGLDTEIESDEIEILHFPMRTFAQFENKIVKGGRALEANTRMSKGKVATWRELYALWQEGGLREHYDAAVVPTGAPPAGFVEDTRVRDFLRASNLSG
jgi:hypothetical protein